MRSWIGLAWLSAGLEREGHGGLEREYLPGKKGRRGEPTESFRWGRYAIGSLTRKRIGVFGASGGGTRGGAAGGER